MVFTPLTFGSGQIGFVDAGSSESEDAYSGSADSHSDSEHNQLGTTPTFLGSPERGSGTTDLRRYYFDDPTTPPRSRVSSVTPRSVPRATRQTASASPTPHARASGTQQIASTSPSTPPPPVRSTSSSLPRRSPTPISSARRAGSTASASEPHRKVGTAAQSAGISQSEFTETANRLQSDLRKANVS